MFDKLDDLLIRFEEVLNELEFASMPEAERMLGLTARM